MSDQEATKTEEGDGNDAPAAVIGAFYERYMADLRRGAVADSAVYRALFPGYERAIDDELDALSRSAAEAAAPRFGRFRLIRELGRGGQGVVHLAEDPTIGRHVALKILRGGASSTLAPARERFRREVEVTAKLDLPGICPLYETGVEGDDMWFTMRFAEGETLAKRIDRRVRSDVVPAPPLFDDSDGGASEGESVEGATLRSARFVAMTARIVHEAHERGVVHRDLKPANLMVQRDGTPLVLDFGLAHADDVASAGLTRTGDVFGTPAYMAPEQIRPDLGPVDRRTDVFALGCVLHELLTDRRPFVAEGRDALAASILRDDPPDPRVGRPWIGADLAAAAAKALEKRPGDRYATAAAFAEDLERAARGLRVRARRGPIGNLARLARRRPKSVGAAIVAVVVAVLFGADRLGRNEAADLRAEISALVARSEALRPLDLRAVRREAGALAAWRADVDAALSKRADLEDALSRLRTDETRVVPGPPIDEAAASRRVAERIVAVSDFAGRFSTVGSPRAARVVARAEETASRIASGSPLIRESTTYAHPRDEQKDAELSAALADLDALEGLRAELDAEEKAAAREARDEDAPAWERVDRDVAADPRFAGLHVKRQRLLSPLGADPASGLQEFAVVGTGRVPERAPDGSLAIDATTALVIVLIPGGDVRVGARADDPLAADVERPVVTARLDPFFIAKHETTQADWLRVIGSESSSYYANWSSCGRTITFRHPAESMTRDEAAAFAARFGLRLPTETEWEVAARAGGETPWPNGAAKESLEGAANVADASQAALGREADVWRREEWIDDGWCRHAPVGVFRPNAFGLRDVAGNVAEWCADAATFGMNEKPVRDGDGLREGGHPFKGVVRGGGWKSNASNCRVSARRIERSDYRGDDVGFRVARSIER